MSNIRKLVDIGLDGSKLYHNYDPDTGKGVYETIGDAQEVLDQNQRDINQESGNFKGDMHHMARIDAVTWQKWWVEFGGNPMSPENKPRLFAKLNSREFSKLRVKSGRM